MKEKFVYLFFLLSFSFNAFAQELPTKGVPSLKNFKPIDYNYKGKIWAMDSAPNGILYMASDMGLIEYDGESWDSYKGSDGIIRSVLVVNDSLIYTGSDLDFGVWVKNIYQKFEYKSLYPFKEDLNTINEEFWDVYVLEDKILFISSSNIYVYKGESLTKISAPNNIESSFIVNDILYIVDQKQGLFEFRDLALKHIVHFQEFNDLEIVSMYESNNGLVLVSKNNGLYRLKSGVITPLNNKLSLELKKSSVFSFEKISEEYFAFGTILQGLYISDLNGSIVHHINKNKGLLNNTVLSMHHSIRGKFWLSMDYGVSFLDLGNEYTYFYDYAGNYGTGYSAQLKDGIFYLGTNQGLYKTDWDNLGNGLEPAGFGMVPNTEGQVWTTRMFDDKIWIGHDRGLFIYDRDKVELVRGEVGIWTIVPYKEYLLAGTYNGISIFKKDLENWSFVKQMDLILGSTRQVIIEEENILWVNIPNYGVIRASLNEGLYPEDRQIFLSKEFKGFRHSLVENDRGVLVKTDEYAYEYDSATNKFNETILEETQPEIDELIIDNSHPIKLNNNFEFYSIYNGFALKDLNLQNLQKNQSPQVVFREMIAFNNDDRKEFFNDSEIEYQLNNLKIKSIVPNQDNVLYQYNFDSSEGWSDWISDNTFELIGLESGSYQLAARAKVNGKLTPIEIVEFRILPPWYKTAYAYLLYLAVVILLVSMFYFWRHLSHKKLKKVFLIDQKNSLKEQAERYQEKLKRAEKENLQAGYEELKTKLKSKTIGLASKAKENEELNKVLQTLKEKFEKLENNPESLKTRSKEIKQIINAHISEDDDTFELQMDQLHQEFFKKLRQGFPELTSYDLRLCAYLKKGFNSKEIANMLNIRPSSVYISRSRLRKKLDIDMDEDLSSYLNSF